MSMTMTYDVPAERRIEVRRKTLRIESEIPCPSDENALVDKRRADERRLSRSWEAALEKNHHAKTLVMILTLALVALFIAPIAEQQRPPRSEHAFGIPQAYYRWVGFCRAALKH